MKLKTTLTPGQLKKVGLGLQKLAESQTSEIELENSAEVELIRKRESLFEIMVDSLQEEVANLLLDKD